MTNAQWSKIIERLYKYKEVKLPDNERLILWDDGTVTLQDDTDGHCIICADTSERIKPIFVR